MENPDAKSALRLKKILLIDDNDAFRAAIKPALEEGGYSVTETDDGSKAIDIYYDHAFRHAAFDIVLLDLRMPGGVDGENAWIRLLEARPKPKVILVTGDKDSPILKRMGDCGIEGYLIKPFANAELLEKIKKILH